MSTAVERIARWAARLRYEDIPPRVVDKAKLQILSMLAAVYSGYPTRAVRAIREVALGSRANGRATVLPSGEKTSPAAAVTANAAASMALDFDDYLFMGHTGHSAVLATLALAEESGASGRDLLRAQIAANELSGRLGAAVMLGPQNGQLWTHIHAVGSALAGALLLGLDAQACAHAMALSLYQPPMAMWPGFMGPDSKLISASWPARDGICAARMASWGLTGPLDILDSSRGFGSLFAYQFLPQMLTGWGQGWVSDTLCYKIVPGCAYIDAALDALFETSEQFAGIHNRPLEPADVISIRVGTSLLGAEMQRLADSQLGEKLTSVAVNFSIPYSLAVAVRAGRLAPVDLEEEALGQSADEIRGLAAKVEVQHDWAMTLQMLSSVARHMPLADLVGELDLRRLLSLRAEMGLQFGPLTELRPRDLLRMTSFVWNRAPDLVRRAGRAAATGLGRLVGEEPEPGAEGFHLGLADFEHMPMPLPAEVSLTVRGDRRLTARVDLPRGAAGRDFAETKGLVRRKFRDQAVPLLTEERARQAIERVDRLEEVDNLSSLTELLTAG